MKCFLENAIDEYGDYEKNWRSYISIRVDEKWDNIERQRSINRGYAYSLAEEYEKKSSKKGRELTEEIAKRLRGKDLPIYAIAFALDLSENEVRGIVANLDDKYKEHREEDNEIMQIRFDDKNDSEDLIQGRLEGMMVEKINTAIRMTKAFGFYNCDACWATGLEYKKIEDFCKFPLEELETLMEKIAQEDAENKKKLREVAERMLRQNEPIDKIIEYSSLSKKDIKEIKKDLKI